MFRRIPFAFARNAGLIADADGTDRLDVVARADAAPWSLAELRRAAGLPLRVSIVPVAEFEAALSAGYAEGEGGEFLADGFGGGVELASDLLEATTTRRSSA
jgi:hypothetical protein